jgi:four helix bundle protein
LAGVKTAHIRAKWVTDPFKGPFRLICMAPYDRLKAFEKSYELGLAVLKSTERWPKLHMYGLAAQARRASASVSINIAEGVCKRGRRELRRYLDIALGSLAETEVLLRFARDMKFIPADEMRALEPSRDEAGRLTWALYEATTKGNGRPLSPPGSTIPQRFKLPTDPLAH